MSVTVLPLRSSVLREIAQLIGRSEAIRLSLRFGGQLLAIPKEPRAETSLVAAIGLKNAQALGRHFGGCGIHISAGAGVKARIIELRKRGVTVRRIAPVAGRTERTVWKVLADYRNAGGSLQGPCELTDEEAGFTPDLWPVEEQ